MTIKKEKCWWTESDLINMEVGEYIYPQEHTPDECIIRWPSGWSVIHNGEQELFIPLL
jgi:hypothetical protein